MTVAVTLAGGNKFVTLWCCSDDVILCIGIGYWYRWRPIVLGILHGIVLTLTCIAVRYQQQYIIAYSNVNWLASVSKLQLIVFYGHSPAHGHLT